jgi:hypothetical protein
MDSRRMHMTTKGSSRRSGAGGSRWNRLQSDSGEAMAGWCI